MIAISLIITIVLAGMIVALCLCKAAKDEPRRGIRVGGVKPFANRSIESRLALGLLAQESHKNKRK